MDPLFIHILQHYRWNFTLFFSAIVGFIIKSWLYIYNSSLATIFIRLLGIVGQTHHPLKLFTRLSNFLIRSDLLVNHCHWLEEVKFRENNIFGWDNIFHFNISWYILTCLGTGVGHYYAAKSLYRLFYCIHSYLSISA